MGTFTRAEAMFLEDMRLGRLATLADRGDPVVVPVGYELLPDGSLRIIGYRLEESAKWRHLQRDPRCSFVVDEGIGRTARGVLVRGEARLVTADDGGPAILLVPRRVVSWGIDTEPFQRSARDVPGE